MMTVVNNIKARSVNEETFKIVCYNNELPRQSKKMFRSAGLNRKRECSSDILA